MELKWFNIISENLKKALESSGITGLNIPFWIKIVHNDENYNAKNLVLDYSIPVSILLSRPNPNKNIELSQKWQRQ